MTGWSDRASGYPERPPVGGNGPYIGPDEPTVAASSYQPPPVFSPPSAAPPPGPWAAGGPPPFGPNSFGPPPFGPPRKSRRPLFIALGACAAVVVIMVVLVVVLTGRGGGRELSASDVVKGYLEALSRGDAEAALSYSNDQPGSKEFLTDDVLKRQIDKWPITNIRILNPDDANHSYGFAQVHVVVNFGNQTSDANLSVKKADGHWKLESAAIKLDTTGPGGTDNESLETLAIFGKPVGKSTVYVFPGWLDIGSSNRNLSVTSKPMLLDSLGRAGGAFFVGDAKFDLSNAGKSAVMSALAESLEQCTKSTSLTPPNCPQNAYDDSVVDGTVEWGKPDQSDVKITFFDPYRLEARLSGQVVFPVRAQARDGGTKWGTVTSFISRTADVSKSPPVIAQR